MRSNKGWLSFLGGLLVTGCASLHTYEMPKVEEELAHTVQTTENVMQKTQSDLREKTELVNRLAKSGGSTFQELEPKLRHHLAVMEENIGIMNARRKEMNESNGQIVSLAYAHPNIQSEDPDYDKVDQAVREFQTATKGLNLAVGTYSAESNQLADEVTTNKLYFNFDVAEFQKQVREITTTARNNLDIMRKALGDAQDHLNQWPTATPRKAHEAIFTEMGTTAKDYSEQAIRLTEIGKAMLEVTQGAARMSTLDPSWPDAKRLIDEFNQLTPTMGSSFEKFQTLVTRFREVRPTD